MIHLELKWDLEAEKEFRNLDKEVQEKIKTEIEELPEKGLEWGKSRTCIRSRN